MIAARGILLLALSAAAPAALLQEPEREAERDSELDRLLHAAVEGSAPVRPQAARRIHRLWERGDEGRREELVARLRAEAGETSDDLAELGSALVEVLGELGDPLLRERLWEAVADPDFPWRPYAARGLAQTARPEEHDRLRALLTDPIGPVRAAAVQALDTLDAREDAPAVRESLGDELGIVRRAAADLLARWGHEEALWILVEELRRGDRFFDRPTGREARYKAAGLLREHLEDLAGYDPGSPPADNAEALEAIAAGVRERAGARPELPPTARATSALLAGEVIGLELRSCRKGEFYLRWTADDRLLVGLGTPAVVELPEGTTGRLREATIRHTDRLERRSVGRPGCDLELLHLKRDGHTGLWIVSKGPDAIEDLRPDPLGALHRELTAVLPDEPHEDPRLDRLRSRALAALEAIGGPLGE